MTEDNPHQELSELKRERFLSEGCDGPGFQGVCFRDCNEVLVFSELNGLATFGPKDISKDTEEEECDCTEFEIQGARLSMHHEDNLPQAIGRSDDLVPFSTVVMRRSTPSPHTGLNVTWISGGKAPFDVSGSCTALYRETSGPIVLDNEQSTVDVAWFAAIFGCVIVITIVVALSVYCGFLYMKGSPNFGRTRRTQPISPRPEEWNYPRSSMTPSSKKRSSNLSNDTDSGYPIGARSVADRHPHSDLHNGRIPNAVIVPVDDDGRQLAVV